MVTSLVPASPAVVAVFSKSQRLSVRQRKRWLEILTSFDARNTYVVYDEQGNPVLNVAEQGSGFAAFLKRIFLTHFRPFTSHVEDLTAQRQVLTLHRPFRFIFHRLEVSDAAGPLIGAIQRKWTWFRRKYVIEGPAGCCSSAAKTFAAPLTSYWARLARTSKYVWSRIEAVYLVLARIDSREEAREARPRREVLACGLHDAIIESRPGPRSDRDADRRSPGGLP